MTTHAELIAAAREQVEIAIGPGPYDVDRPTAKRDGHSLAERIDHTLLLATATQSQIEKLCAEALQYGFASVCVNSRWVPTVAETLRGSSVLTCTVVGFPLGAMNRLAKAGEAHIAVHEGAQEIDMVMDIGALLSGDLAGTYEDMRAVAAGAGSVPVKVILETCLLTDEQKAIACLLALRSGVAYVKTSTGFSTGGATTADIALMRACVGDALGVKASGGIHSRSEAESMLAAGADRIGASASVAIATGGSSASGY